MKAQDQIFNVKKCQNKKLPTITQSTRVVIITAFICDLVFPLLIELLFTVYVPSIQTRSTVLSSPLIMYHVSLLTLPFLQNDLVSIQSELYTIAFECFMRNTSVSLKQKSLKQNVFSDMWIKLFLKVFNYYDIVSRQNYCSYLLHFHCKYFCQSGHWSLSR